MIIDENIDSEQGAVTHMSDQDIFTKIWLQPKKVFRYLSETDYNKHVTLLLVLSGMANAFDKSSEKGYWDEQEPIIIISLALLLGGAFGWIGYYIYSVLLSISGKWLGGIASSRQIFNVLAYASFPIALSLILITFNLLIFGVDVFKSSFDFSDLILPLQIFFYGSIFLMAVLGIYSIVLSIVAISEVQRFSIGRAIGNAILAVLTLIVPILLFFILFL